MSVNLEGYVPGLLVLVIAILLVFCGYKKYIAPYTVFPTSWVLHEIIMSSVTGRIPRNTTRSSYIFQLAIKNLRKHSSKGYCVSWLPKPYIIIFNEEAVKILSNDQAALNKGDRYHVLADFLRSGLITSNEELWRKRRKMFQPAFQISVVKNQVTIFNENAANLVQRLMTIPNEPVDITRYLKECSIENLLVTVFGIDSDNPMKKEVKEQIIEKIDVLADLLTERMANPFLLSKLTLPLFASGRKFTKHVEETRALLKNELQMKIKDSTLKKHAERSSADDTECLVPLRKSFAEIIIQAHLQDPSFTLDDVTDEINTLIFAGYDTVATALMWCLFLLGNHQDVQDEVYYEVEHLMGKDISYEDVQSLTYTESVIKETLRLYPTVPVYTRQLKKDILCGEYNIPKDANIVFFPYLLHRNPEIYPNPEKFDPERFRSNTNKNPWSFTPFSEGMRSCLGKKFAMIQMKITLAYILQNFKLASQKNTEDVQEGWEIVLVPNQPLRLTLTPRRHATQQG